MVQHRGLVRHPADRSRAAQGDHPGGRPERAGAALGVVRRGGGASRGGARQHGVRLGPVLGLGGPLLDDLDPTQAPRPPARARARPGSAGARRPARPARAPAARAPRRAGARGRRSGRRPSASAGGHPRARRSVGRRTAGPPPAAPRSAPPARCSLSASTSAVSARIAAAASSGAAATWAPAPAAACSASAARVPRRPRAPRRARAPARSARWPARRSRRRGCVNAPRTARARRRARGPAPPRRRGLSRAPQLGGVLLGSLLGRHDPRLEVSHVGAGSPRRALAAGGTAGRSPSLRRRGSRCRRSSTGIGSARPTSSASEMTRRIAVSSTSARWSASRAALTGSRSAAAARCVSAATSAGSSSRRPPPRDDGATARSGARSTGVGCAPIRSRRRWTRSCGGCYLRDDIPPRREPDAGTARACPARRGRSRARCRRGRRGGCRTRRTAAPRRRRRPPGGAGRRGSAAGPGRVPARPGSMPTT